MFVQSIRTIRTDICFADNRRWTTFRQQDSCSFCLSLNDREPPKEFKQGRSGISFAFKKDHSAEKFREGIEH